MAYTPIYDYKISTLGNIFHGTGTISVSAASKNVSGGSTSFTTQLAVGDVIVSGGQTLAIATITNNTALVLQTAAVGAISTAAFDYWPLTNVETLTTPAFAPKSIPKPWYEGVDTGDGLARGMGRQVTSWKFDFVNQAFRNALRTRCTGKAQRLYIRTRQIDSSDSFITYEAAMIWPDLENRTTTRRLNFEIVFRDLIVL